MTYFFFPRRNSSGRWFPALSLGLAALGLGLSFPGAAPAAGRAATAKTYAVREVTNLRYGPAKDPDAAWHRLDLYLPKGKKSFPVIMFVHGGAWVIGDKDFLGWGADIGRFFAQRGIGAVMPSYRLSPAVKHPEHVKDLAKAFAWVGQNITKYGGAADQLFLCGHSAGGHLVSLLATDPAYLKGAGVKPSAVKGVISVSGVYRIPEINFNFTLPKELSGAAPGKKKSATTVNFRLNLFSLVFGDDPKVLKGASPLSHVKRGLPPFLLVYAGHDIPFLPQMAREFARALKAVQCPVRLLRVKDRDHDTVMFSATSAADPVAKAICRFIAKLSTKR
jgi:acetyl esterase/lipase